ncbi:uncharacterized protein LOC111601989 [Drosophila hydei]|uniref:Uncharacterized protein LOC111601989 n=1 Tax=Drosophila hydei TaxID=7224 RepID=A0A6J1M1F4_DROHY|nr:uncharacterized protein LOC111601989 [Drosophila hydei]
MEYILEIAEAVDQQSKEEQEEINRFKSVYTINGKAILSPLMTPERRQEMQSLRRAAMAIEDQVEQRAQAPSETKRYTLKHKHVAVGSGCSLMDASTNTEGGSELKQQPLTVVGRIKQQLQLSETLIYDNKCNAIIKFIKPTKSTVKQQMMCEEYLQLKPQQALLIEVGPKYGAMLSTTLAAAESLPKQVPSLPCLPLQSQELATTMSEPNQDGIDKLNQDGKLSNRMQTMRQLLSVAQMLKLSINRRERELLHRAITSPALRPRADNVTPCDHDTYRSERLHPQLWKRYHSYSLNYELGAQEKEVAASAAAAAAAAEPAVVVPRTPTSAATKTSNLNVSSVAPSPSKIQVKQQHSTPDQRTNKSVLSALPKRSSNSKSGKRTPRARSTVSYAAHASSHANAVQQGANDSSTRISSTQRRLSYDPRATIKRAAALRKAESSSSCGRLPTATKSPSNSNVVQAAATAPSAECSTSELIRRKLLDDMEEQHRQRFQHLVSQQAEEQQRMQAEFQSQQQQLMDQMICDLSTMTYDKDEQTDQANSESSSINSLPQSRLDLELDEPETADS